MATLIILLILVVSVSFAVKKMVRDKKSGKSIQCGGDCRKCGGGCH